MSDKLFKIGISHGDLNGIGYEIIIKALSDNKMLELCHPIVYGLSKVASFYRKNLEIQDFSFQFIKNTDQITNKKPCLINIYDEEIKIEIGAATKIAGQMAERALYMAGKDLKARNIDALVTAPINIDNIQSEKFTFAGHTEFFEHYFGGTEQKSMMMMVYDDLRVGFVTHHQPINKLSEHIHKKNIYRKLEILDRSLRRDFSVANPTIAVLTLNPTQQDIEEKEHISPAIELAFQNRINAFGPFPADEFFSSGHFKRFDAVLAMHHDQGVLPFQLLNREAVQFTAGLPIVHTAPFLGTNYELAGKNKSNGQSMRNAIYLALDILKNRENQ